MNSLSKRSWLWSVVVVIGLGALGLYAQAPSWWTNRVVIATNAAPRDYAPITQGQLKWLATQAAAEFTDNGLTSSNITALLASFSLTNNYLPVNLGQLKNVAQPFYDCLFTSGLTNCYPAAAGQPYPWSNATNAANHSALANIGQTKYLFSFDLTAAGYSTLNDGVPDWWKRLYGYSSTNAASTIASNGLTLIENYVKGLNPNQPLGGLTIPNAWAVYTNSTNVTVFADIRSASNAVTVKAAEFFIDNTNGVVFGSGKAMSALDGAFDSTNEMALATFTPTFAAGTRHFAYIHAQGSNNNWCPFVKVIINPNIHDILGKIQANYSAIQTLQFEVTTVEYQNGVSMSASTASVKMKGPYKIRTDNATGFVSIKNDNRIWWYNEALNVGGAMTIGIDDNFSPQGGRCADFFWDIPTSKARMTLSLGNAASTSIYNCSLAPQTGVSWPAQIFVSDFSKGAVLFIEGKSADNLMRSEYQNLIEVLPGKWLFSLHRHIMQFDSGDQIVVESTMNNIMVNKGLDDLLFNIPAE
jgi:outer membrane lipoprotein-sorting protein